MAQSAILIGWTYKKCGGARKAKEVLMRRSTHVAQYEFSIFFIPDMNPEILEIDRRRQI